MIVRPKPAFVAFSAMILCSCATTSIRQIWKSPEATSQPVGAVAVLAVDERGIVRVGVENRFAGDLESGGQTVLRTHEMLSLREIRDDEELAARKLREAGAAAVLITRLVTSEMLAASVRVGDERYAPVTTGFSPGWGYGPYDWYGYYTLAFRDMGTVWSSQNERVQLETSLFDLANGHRLWACLTDTLLRENADRVVEIDNLTAVVVGALREDGLVK